MSRQHTASAASRKIAQHFRPHYMQRPFSSCVCMQHTVHGSLCVVRPRRRPQAATVCPACKLCAAPTHTVHEKPAAPCFLTLLKCSLSDFTLCAACCCRLLAPRVALQQSSWTQSCRGLTCTSWRQHCSLLLRPAGRSWQPWRQQSRPTSQVSALVGFGRDAWLADLLVFCVLTTAVSDQLAAWKQSL